MTDQSQNPDQSPDQSEVPDLSHPGAGLDEETARRVGSLGTDRELETSGPEYLAMDADAQAGRGADGDTAAREAQEGQTS